MTHCIRTGLRALALTLVLFSMSLWASGFPVFDAAALTENMLHRILYLDQWARDNLAQADQLSSLNVGNNIAQGSHELMAQNYAMDLKASWAHITALQEDSLGLLHATQSTWEEFGSVGQYLAAFYKAEAWERCFEGTSPCTFGTVVKKLDNEAIDQALSAYQHAQAMSQKLERQVQALQNLSAESQSSHSAAGTLDALSKINGAVASSLVDLNSQLAVITKLHSHQLARTTSKERSNAAHSEALLRYSPQPTSKLPTFLPEINYRWPY